MDNHKINVLWVDEHNSSKQNGIGTYRNQLIDKLGVMPDVNLTLISLNSDSTDLTIVKHEFGTEFAVPTIAGGNWRGNGPLIWPVLRQYIADSKANVFMLNHSPCSDFIRSLREMFPLSRITFTIHDQGWCSTLLGDSGLLRSITIDGRCPDGVDESDADYVRTRKTQDLDIYSNADKVVCLSESTRKVLLDIYGVEDNKITLIPNGYAPTGATKKKPSKRLIRNKLGLQADDEVMIFVGRPTFYKGITAPLRAIKLLRTEHPHLRCIMAGSIKGLSNFWDDAAAIAPNLICIGQVSQSELRKWYAASDIGVMASYSEQCSYAALEMMNNGLMIVASDGHGVRDVFTDGENAMVAHIGDVFDVDTYAQSLAEAIDRALKASPAQKRRHAAANRHLLETRFSTDNMAKAYAEMLRSIVCE